MPTSFLGVLTEMEHTVLRAARRTTRGVPTGGLLWHTELGACAASTVDILVLALEELLGIDVDQSAEGPPSLARAEAREISPARAAPLITVVPLGGEVLRGEHQHSGGSDQLLLECTGTPAALAAASDYLGQLSACGRHDLVARCIAVIHQEPDRQDCTDLMSAAGWFTENCGHCVLLTEADPTVAGGLDRWTNQPIDRRLAILEVAVRLAGA